MVIIFEVESDRSCNIDGCDSCGLNDKICCIT